MFNRYLSTISNGQSLTMAYMTTFPERLKEALDSAGMRPVDLSTAIGITRAAVSSLTSGRTKAPTPENLYAIADALGVSPRWLATGRGDIHGSKEGLIKPTVWTDRSELAGDDVVFVPMLSVELAAGDGASIEEYVKTTMPFARHTLRTYGVKEECAFFVEVAGDSMEPRLHDGNHVLVDTSIKTPREGQAFAIRDGEMLRVKYLIPLPNRGIRIRSENRGDYPDEDLSAEEFAERVEIIGQVVGGTFMGW